MSTEDIAALKELCEKATPGPWEVVKDADKGFDVWQVEGTYVAVGTIGGAVEDEPDAEFIAAARSAVPALKAEVERLRGALGQIEREIDEWPDDAVENIARILASLDDDRTDTKEQTSE